MTHKLRDFFHLFACNRQYPCTMCVSATMPSNHVGFFFPPLVFSHTCTDKCSAEYSRRIRCLSLEFSLCMACSWYLTLLIPLDFQFCLFNSERFPGFIWVTHPWITSWALSKKSGGVILGLTSFFFSRSLWYGSFVAPLYSTLSLWVWLFLLFFFFRFHLWDQTPFLFLCLTCFI